MRIYTHKEKTKTSKGYIMLYIPNHYRADKKGRVMEHIVVWEKENGKELPEGYVIHHVNGIKDDNRIENLFMMTSAEHTKFHHINSKRTDETKSKISIKAKQRLENPKNHPMYKEIPIKKLYSMVKSGYTVKYVCEMYNISKTTYYKKIKKEGII